MKNNYFNKLVHDCAIKEINEFPASVVKSGLNKKQSEESEKQYGKNTLPAKNKNSILFHLERAFFNPYSIVLMILDLVSILTDIIFSDPKKFTTVAIITSMLLISGVIRFIQELKSKIIVDKLTKIINVSVKVKRDGKIQDIVFDDLVLGDLVILKAGDQVPLDLRLTKVQDLFVSQSIITGESGILEKSTESLKNTPKKIIDYNNTLFQGTTIVSGFCEGIVVALGNETIYGGFQNSLEKKKQSFDKGASSIVWVLVKFMAFLIPIVFVASGLTKGDWISAFIFSISVAIGLTPELLPMVITSCLSFGSKKMEKKQTIVKDINAMKEFGSMDLLCVDKTGTITEDALILEYYMDILGNECQKTLNLGFLNSYFSSGFNNHVDQSILKFQEIVDKINSPKIIKDDYSKLDEMPFDYSRKISSVLLSSNHNNLLISKGNVDDILIRCNKFEYKGEIHPLNKKSSSSAHAIVDEMLDDGMKVLAIAYKETSKNIISKKDECNLILLGYLCFFDSPKKTAFQAIDKLNKLNIGIKVLTGDNKKVAFSVCRRLGLNYQSLMTGEELDSLNGDEISLRIENTQVFAELTPKQKGEIIKVLQSNGHNVGYLGDGMNDLHAMVLADVGISVDNASPSLKDACDVVLLKKDLNILEEGVKEGRKAFSNMNKYIRITASSNLGNILSIVIASIFLPFFPMTSIQLLLLNLLYDVLCLALPWDHVDQEMCEKPLDWSSNKLSKFMLFFGPISSIFDVITFAFLFFYLCPTIVGGPFSQLTSIDQNKFISIFQTGWFLESMWTQILILHLLRTNKIPFVQSNASISFTLITVFGIILFTCLVMTPLGEIFGLTSLPFSYFIFLILIVMSYLLVMSLVKKIYLSKNKSLQ